MVSNFGKWPLPIFVEHCAGLCLGEVALRSERQQQEAVSIFRG